MTNFRKVDILHKLRLVTKR